MRNAELVKCGMRNAECGNLLMRNAECGMWNSFYSMIGRIPGLEITGKTAARIPHSAFRIPHLIGSAFKRLSQTLTSWCFLFGIHLQGENSCSENRLLLQ